MLESYSKSLLPFIEWEETEGHNLQVTNRTVDYYRYFDATLHAEFLYSCVLETIRENLPAEVAYLEAFDTFAAEVQGIVDLPQRTVDKLATFLGQADGRLSRKRAAQAQLSALTDVEINRIEELYAETIGKARN